MILVVKQVHRAAALELCVTTRLLSNRSEGATLAGRPFVRGGAIAFLSRPTVTVPFRMVPSFPWSDVEVETIQKSLALLWKAQGQKAGMGSPENKQRQMKDKDKRSGRSSAGPEGWHCRSVCSAMAPRVWASRLGGAKAKVWEKIPGGASTQEADSRSKRQSRAKGEPGSCSSCCYCQEEQCSTRKRPTGQTLGASKDHCKQDGSEGQTDSGGDGFQNCLERGN
eukprot:326775-Amphidinium_carterae.1